MGGNIVIPDGFTALGLPHYIDYMYFFFGFNMFQPFGELELF